MGRRPTFLFGRWLDMDTADTGERLHQPSDLLARIEAAISPALQAMGFDLVRVRLSGSRRPVLQIMAERENGEMTITDCALVSRTLSALLDVEDPIKGEYLLEVSSPGMDRPLTRLKDFVVFAGSLVKLELTRPLNGRRRFRGALAGVAGGNVQLLLEDGAMIALPFTGIGEAQLVITDEMIRESMKRNSSPAVPE